MSVKREGESGRLSLLMYACIENFNVSEQLMLSERV